MRILGLADIHGAHRRIADALAREPQIALVLLAGDLTTNGTARDAHKALDALGKQGPRAFAVAGNMDPRPVEDVLATTGTALDGRGVMVGDVGLFGLSGAPLSPLHTPNECTEDELMARLVAGWEAVKGARWTLLVSHAPPAGTMVDRLTSGMHAGSTAVREFCEAYRPDLVLCGHIHEARGIDHVGQTIVVNPGPAHTGAYCTITMGDVPAVALRQL